VVNGIVFRVDQLRDGDHGEPFVSQTLQNVRQCLGSMESSVVKKGDAACCHLAADTAADGGGIIIFPVQ